MWLEGKKGKEKEIICTMRDVFSQPASSTSTIRFSFRGCQLVKVSHTHFKSQSLFT